KSSIRTPLMSDEINFGGVRYLSAHEAAKISRLSQDYISKLCRAKKIDARRVGKNWYVRYESLQEFLLAQTYAKVARKETLSAQRVREYYGVENDSRSRSVRKSARLPAKTSVRSPFEKDSVVVAAELQERAKDLHEKMLHAVTEKAGAGVQHAR